MATNLLKNGWAGLDSAELRTLLDIRIGGPGQYDGRRTNPNTFYLPLAGPSCRLKLRFRDKQIVAIEAGPALDAAEWKQISEDVDRLAQGGPPRVGREYSFSSFRVLGWWRGERSGVQILPPPNDAPRADVEMAEHPFILEFPISGSDLWAITNYRRQREHRRLTLLLNVLLVGRTGLQPRRPEHCWALVAWHENHAEFKWVQRQYFAKLGKAVADEHSPPVGDGLETVEPEEYYTKLGNDGRGLRVPADLDGSICRYLQLSEVNRRKFDRAAYWMDIASRQWSVSVSASFASLVSAVEALTNRGAPHRVYCEECEDYRQHDAPGATDNFRAFLEKYAPGAALRSRRNEMYSLRSGILHGSTLMQLDQDLAFGWDPPWWNEYEMHDELWSITRVALRNWLKAPPSP